MASVQTVGIEYVINGAQEAQAANRAIAESFAALAKAAQGATDDMKKAGGAGASLASRLAGLDTSSSFVHGAESARTFGDRISSLAEKELPHLVSSLATLGGVAVGALGSAAWKGFDITTQLQSNRTQLGLFMQDTQRGNQIMDEAIAFGQRYGYTQTEMSSAIAGATQVIKASKQPISEQISALARLGTLNPEEGFKGAAFALKELVSGDVQSLVERFNVSRDTAYQLRDAIQAGQDPILLMNQYLNDMGITTDILEARMKGQAGAINGMKLAAENAAIAFGQMVAPTITSGLESLTVLFGQVEQGIKAFNGGIEESQSKLQTSLVSGSASYEEYVASATNANAQMDAAFSQSTLGFTTFVNMAGAAIPGLQLLNVGISSLTPSVDTLTAAQYAYVQSLVSGGMSMQAALVQLQSLGPATTSIGTSIGETAAYISMTAPQIGAAFAAMGPQIIAVAGMSSDTAIAVQGLIDEFAMTGDIEAFQTALNNLSDVFSLGRESSDSVQQSIQFLTETIGDAQDSTPALSDEFSRLTGEMILEEGAAYRAAEGIFYLTDAQYANIDADYAKQISSEQNKLMQADLELAVLKVEQGLWSQAAATQYLATQYGITADEAANLYNQQAALAALTGQITEIRGQIGKLAPPPTTPRGGRGGGGGGKGKGAGAGKKERSPEEMMKDTFDIVSKGIDATNKLQDFIKPSQEMMSNFSQTMADLVKTFYADLSSVGTVLKDEGAQKFAKGAKDAVDVIGSGVDALMKLNRFKQPTDQSITSFLSVLKTAVIKFYEAAQEAAYTFDVIAPLFAKSAKDAIDIIGSGVEALMKLNEYDEPTRESLFIFSHNVRDAVVDFWHRAQEISYLLKDQSSEQFAKAAQAALGLIATGVDALMKLNEYVGPSREALFAFSHDVRDAIADFWHRAQEINYALDDAAPLFADVGKKVTDTIGSAVEAFTKLSQYRGVPRSAIESMSRDIELAVALMSQMAAKFSVEGSKAVAEFADAVTKILGPFKTAIDIFGEFEAYAGIAPEAMQRVGADIEQATLTMQEIADRANTDGIKRAAEFASSVSTIFSGLKTGIDGLDAIREYESVPSERMGALLNDFMAMLTTLATMNAQSDTAIQQAASWSSNMTTIANLIRAGADTIGSLNGLNVLSTISVGVGTSGVDMFGGSVSPPSSTGEAGNISTTNNTNIQYNYNANYAAPPASPAVGFDIASSLSGS